ncbi:hypothetical protein [Gordonia malaquae]|uniref:hypothetical protein n=1 Tax=Gordonia malaquae TaxID=410332 RepID=UPI0030FE5F68
MNAAEGQLTIRTAWSDPNDAPDGLCIPVADPAFPHVAKTRTGEGIAEQFWGTVTQLDANGKARRVRQRVRSNVLLETDEGSGLVKLIKDDKETVGETLREAWSGQMIGQSNADEAKYRPVEKGSYTLAVVTGMQLSVLGDLLTREELNKGTPQRFLYAWCRPDPRAVTEETISAAVDPGPLEVPIPARGLYLCDALRERVRAERIADWLADDNDQPSRLIESQRLAQVARLAGLLAILDARPAEGDGRLQVTEDDWTIAEAMFATSIAIADRAVAERRRSAADAKRAERERNLAEAIEDDEARQTPEGRAAARLIGYLQELPPGPHPWSGKGGLRARKFNGAHAKDADAALDQLDGQRVRVVRTARADGPSPSS